jgi:hypothetical protein
VLHEEIEACHSKEHKQGVGTPVLGEANVVGHENQRQGAGKGGERRKLSCKKIDHGDGKGSEDQGDNSKVSLGLGERIELVSENKEEGRMKIRRVLFIKFYLALQIISGVVEAMDLVYPEGFSIKSVKPQGEADNETENENEDLFSFFLDHSKGVNIHSLASTYRKGLSLNKIHVTQWVYRFLFLRVIEDPRERDKWKRHPEIG